MNDPVLDYCSAYAAFPDSWKWALGIYVVLLLLSAYPGYIHYKRQRRLDKYFAKKPRKQGFKW